VSAAAPATRGGTPGVAAAVDRLARWLSAVYALELELDARRFLVSPGEARELLPADSPRTGVVVVDQDESIFLGLYVDPRDRRNPGVLVEETSHLVCLAWHASRGLPVSRLLLELQAEVDRFAFRALNGGDPLAHFERFRWRDGLDPHALESYRAAHLYAHRYCRRLKRRYPRRGDIPGLLAELRRFYRASPASKLCS